jgi:hypothetical protein
VKFGGNSIGLDGRHKMNRRPVARRSQGGGDMRNMLLSAEASAE